MEKRYRHSLYLQMFNEETVVENTGVEDVPAAEEQTTEATQTEDKSEVAFAKKWAAKEKEWQAQKEAEIQALKDQYKDFDTFKKVTEHVQKSSGISDIMTLKEQVELEELQERAEQENLAPEQLKRMLELEQMAKESQTKAQEYEKQLEEIRAKEQAEKEVIEFESTLKTYCEGKEIDGKPLDHKELWQYMAENDVSNPDIAFKAMKADIIEQQLENAKKDGVKEYLASKSGVKVDKGGGSTVMDKGNSTPRQRLEAALRAQQNQI